MKDGKVFPEQKKEGRRQEEKQRSMVDVKEYE